MLLHRHRRLSHCRSAIDRTVGRQTVQQTPGPKDGDPTVCTTSWTKRDLDVGLSGWQRGLGVAIAIVVVALMIMATSQLLALLLCVSGAAAVVMATAVVAHAVLICAERAGTDRR